jgi:hypothetical protein
LFSSQCNSGRLSKEFNKKGLIKMKYRANPVEVIAFKISSILETDGCGNTELLLENGNKVVAIPEMTSRLKPSIGDYWVQQEDGYIYLNPKQVFERKYSKIKD